MKEDRHYTDLINAHNILRLIGKRWGFYDTYMKNKDPDAWFKSANIPIIEGLLLFGFVHSWDPYFQGDLVNFFNIYKDIFSIIKKFEHTTIINVDLSNEVKNSISEIFDKIARCSKRRRFESTDASKILHAIIPNLFVMWDRNIRKAIIGNKERDGRCYAFEFLPKMQEAAKEYLDDYVKENGGNYESATLQISTMADNHTLAKLIDEYNYVRYTKKISLTDIRNTTL